MGLIFGVAPSSDAHLTPDKAKALRVFAAKGQLEYAAAVGSLTPEQARRLRDSAKAKDDLLMAAIQTGAVTTQTSAEALLVADDVTFPATEFLLCTKEAVGSKASPATWSQVVDAAKALPSAMKAIEK